MIGEPGSALDEAPPLRVRTEPLGGGDLTRDALAGVTPAGWYPVMPASRAEWRARVEAVREQFAAGAWLELVAPALAATGAAAERLERSAKGAGVVVTTGQQPGLFGGPMYTWSKAISALALADQIEAATGTPTAPVFWAATDDADFEEASVTVIAAGPRCTTLRAKRTAPDGTPMSQVPLGDDVPALLDELAQGAGSAAYAVALDAARESYAAGATVGSAYVTLLRTLLAPLGIAVLDASHATTRDAGFNLLRRALMKAADIERAVQARTAEIEAAGYRPQVPDVAGRTLVFADAADGTKARVTVADARALVTRAPRGSLGPNVLLRPVMERYVLPTVAYVAGPGELAYFAQVSAVAEAMAVPAPLAVPRWSGTVLEPHVQRALARLDMHADDLADPHAPERRVAEGALPAEIRARLMALRTVLDAGIDNLAAADAGDSLLPAAVLDGARRALLGRVDRLERRYLAAARRQATDAMQSLLTARAALRPDGTRQERALNAVPLLARHGPALWHAMLAEARPHAAALVDGTPTDAVTHA